MDSEADSPESIPYLPLFGSAESDEEESASGSDSASGEYTIITYLPFRCSLCPAEFADQYALVDHQMIIHQGAYQNQESDDDDEEVDNIPTYPFGSYVCPDCGNRYLTAAQMNEHFAISHTTFTEMLQMDDHAVREDGFPGFDILEQIGMIELPGCRDLDRLIGRLCFICYDRYSVAPDPEIEQTGTVVGYSDDSAMIRPRKPVEREFSPALERWRQKILEFDRRPVATGCCHRPLCRRCVVSMIRITDQLICPFCQHDHQVVDKEYITVIEESDRTDPSRWSAWNITHMLD